MSNSTRNKIIVAITFLVIVVLFFFLSKANNNDYAPVQGEAESNCTYNLYSKLTGLNNKNIIAQFPYTDYLEHSNFNNIECLKKDLTDLDSVIKDPMLSQQILATTLTDSLKKKNNNIYNTYQPDSLIRLMQWVERFKYYAEIDKPNQILFNVIHTQWMQFISDKLALFAKENPTLKYEVKFKFLLAKCREAKFAPPIKVTATEKVIDNLVRSQWGHLFDASWNQASLLQKILLSLLVITFLYGIYCIILKHFFK